MSQTKIIVDSNSYFRLALNIHPLLCQPFGREQYTLYMHAELNAEFRDSPRLQNKFYWAAAPGYRENRKRSLSISKQDKADIAETFDYMWSHVLEAFLDARGKGPSRIDTRIIATASVLNIPVVTDDRDMIELAKEYEVRCISTLALLRLMEMAKHIDRAKVEQVVAQWQYDKDTPYRDWKREYVSLFGREPPAELS